MAPQYSLFSSIPIQERHSCWEIFRSVSWSQYLQRNIKFLKLTLIWSSFPQNRPIWSKFIISLQIWFNRQEKKMVLNKKGVCSISKGGGRDDLSVELGEESAWHASSRGTQPTGGQPACGIIPWEKNIAFPKGINERLKKKSSYNRTLWNCFRTAGAWALSWCRYEKP